MQPETAVTDVLVNTLKTLAIDAIQKANSGHPGMPMGMADAAAVLWADFLVTDPSEPGFLDRDRFVLSGGHGSMLLYGLLHLSGHALSLDELKRFRQLGSLTPGHPESHLTPGVETTTGPLGQGLANAVGMAMAEAHLAARYNRPGFHVIDHWTYALCGDGDLEEGISHEAASLAGHLGLGKLVLLYDDNSITIEGPTSLAFSEDIPARFGSYGWHVQRCDGHDRDAVHAAIAAARADTARPSLICCKTHIGNGSPNKHDSEKAHGSPLGVAEVRLTKENIGWPPDAQFLVPDEAVAALDGLRARGVLKRSHHDERMSRYAEAHPELAAELRSVLAGELPDGLEAALPDLGDKPIATRSSSGKVINALSAQLPALWGGSADLAESTKTLVDGAGSFSRDNRTGRNLHYGIREHGMAGIMNGMALHGGVIPYGATFLTFTDYMRGSMRLAALMRQRVIYVLTHDSVFLGEDGPTHQSVEHAMALRTIPEMHVIRPADARETAAAWLAALRRSDGPTCLLLTRQNLPGLPGTRDAVLGVERGGYVVRDCAGPPALILLATGSEVHLCTGAAEVLAAEGVAVRVVSLPCLERFAAQPAEYRDAVLPPTCLARLSVEAGRTFGWEGFVGPLGESVGIDRFGESAPAEELAELFGLTTSQVADRARALLAAFPAKRAALLKVLGGA
ncbi:MAG: transketolase [Deltaproteobacteria bacterium HGW-Deltaproteobacteria-14]|jgi:transketolase|nr:MAG: transketolase [Deltaproteobacteria bacterium HGW-Deltaproteobacteria-14]